MIKILKKVFLTLYFDLNDFLLQMSNVRLYRFVLNGFNIRKYWEEEFPGDIRLLNDDDMDVDESAQSTEPVSELSYDVAINTNCGLLTSIY